MIHKVLVMMVTMGFSVHPAYLASVLSLSTNVPSALDLMPTWSES